ncbi:glycosyltransferase family 2 protein [uncultured Winogradskyella sp.]|uniref:glycosyltransferase family 2 protein n=1 Tax=uncultured Winogradskyella sp. TaxID=395353 RepID=UPI002639E240|nr:glycosyltransferase family 2 protein [uncultured Winogradskyella sp.]
MLSILIPIYNFEISHLVSDLNAFANQTRFNIEIICLEDGSTLFLEENSSVCKSLNHVTHLISKTNNGRITSRKHLAKSATYDWLLFLDADVEISNKDFIKDYADFFNSAYEAVYGGCIYDTFKPKPSQLLRWKYGRNFEEVSSSIRNKNPYKYIVSANFLIKKDTFNKITNQIKTDGYGYDLFIGQLLMHNKTKILHIDNAVIHKGLDDNDVFLNKIELSVNTLFSLYKDNKTVDANSTLLKTFKKISSYGLKPVVNIIFKVFRGVLKKQLLSSNPNMTLLQFYKLGYLCHLSTVRT